MLVAADAVALVRPWLESALGSTPVFGAVPNPRPDRFVTLARVGGVRPTPVTDAPRLLAECWGSTRGEAQDVCQLAYGAILALPGAVLDGLPVYRVAQLGGPAWLPDPVSGQPRFVFTVEVHIRLRAL